MDGSKVVNKVRNSLPSKTVKCDLGLWSVLKSCVGKDLSKITMPVQFNEPLSFLQRISEILEYESLLSNIDEIEDEVHRMEVVAAFAVSSLASNWNRLGKPFNPLFGETFELVQDGFQFLCEQVSHHPPISAFHAESEKYTLLGWVYPKLKLGAKSIEIHPKGMISLHLKKLNETYSWGNVNCSVHNIIVGKLWIEHHGHLEIQCEETGLSINLHFKGSGWFHNELHKVDGFIIDKNKKKLKYLYGKWPETLKSTDISSYEEFESISESKKRLATDTVDTSGGTGRKSPGISPKPTKKIFQKFNSLSLRSFSSANEHGSEEISPESQDDSSPKGDAEIIEIPNSRTLWQVCPRPENCADFYYFTSFAMNLNIPPSKENTSVCATDSRLRPDIRKLEDGDLEGAAQEKIRLEEKQRKFLKKNPDINPIWFEKNINGDDWKFIGHNYFTSTKKNHILSNIF